MLFWQFEGKKILMGRDRLDTIKGIPQKLLAFEEFLARFPEFRGKAVLFQVCLPPREERKTNKNQTSYELELQHLHSEINEYTHALHIAFVLDGPLMCFVSFLPSDSLGASMGAIPLQTSHQFTTSTTKTFHLKKFVLSIWLLMLASSRLSEMA